MSTVFKVWCMMTWLACVHSYQYSRRYYPQPSASQFNPNHRYNNGFNPRRHYIPRQVNINNRGRFNRYPDSGHTRFFQPIKQDRHAPKSRHRVRINQFPVKLVDNFYNQNYFNRRHGWPVPINQQRPPSQTSVRPRPSMLTNEEVSKLDAYLELFHKFMPYLLQTDLNELFEILKPILPNSQLDKLFQYTVHAFATTNKTTLQNVLQSYSQDSPTFITDYAEKLATALKGTNVLKLMQVLSPILARTDLGDLLETLVLTQDSVTAQATDFFLSVLNKFDWAEIIDVISPAMKRTNLVELSKVFQSAASDLTIEDIIYALFPDYVGSSTAGLASLLPTWATTTAIESVRIVVGTFDFEIWLKNIQKVIPVDSWEQLSDLFRTVSAMFANTDLAELTKLLLPLWHTVNFTRLKETVPTQGNISEIIQTLKTVAPIMGRINLTEIFKTVLNTIGERDIMEVLPQMLDTISQISSKLFKHISLSTKHVASSHLSGFGQFARSPSACKPDRYMQHAIIQQIKTLRNLWQLPRNFMIIKLSKSNKRWNDYVVTVRSMQNECFAFMFHGTRIKVQEAVKRVVCPYESLPICKKWL